MFNPGNHRGKILSSHLKRSLFYENKNWSFIFTIKLRENGFGDWIWRFLTASEIWHDGAELLFTYEVPQG